MRALPWVCSYNKQRNFSYDYFPQIPKQKDEMPLEALLDLKLVSNAVLSIFVEKFHHLCLKILLNPIVDSLYFLSSENFEAGRFS